MQEIKIITDTACDIPKETAQELGITKVPIPITVNGKALYEDIDFTPEEFYKILDSSEEMPKTSHVPAFVFTEEYEKAFSEGYKHIIHVTINSKGSAMYESALMAKNLFFEDHPNANITIDIIDSLAYTLGYGMPLIIAADMIKNGSTKDEIVSYLKGFFKNLELCFSVYDLKTVKKSGRVSCAAAFVGDILGLRPIIFFTDGVATIPTKVRGDKNIIPTLVANAKENIKKGTPYSVVYGYNTDTAKIFAEEIEKAVGYAPFGVYHIGASIAMNAGTNMLGFIYTKNKA